MDHGLYPIQIPMFTSPHQWCSKKIQELQTSECITKTIRHGPIQSIARAIDGNQGLLAMNQIVNAALRSIGIEIKKHQG